MSFLAKREAAKVAAYVTMLLKYSEDQPRDERGRFASGDGGAASGAVSSGEVRNFLNQYYPPEVTDWVKHGNWTFSKSVPLSDIEMGRRPGGRDPKKVEGIAARIKAGEQMKPVVLVRTSEGKLKIADGFHRTLGAAHAGLASLPAYIGSGMGDHGPWDREIHDAKQNTGAWTPRTTTGGAGITYASKAARRAAKLDAWLDTQFVAKYSEDQPRDDHGRWTSDGGGDAKADPFKDERWTKGEPWKGVPDSRDLYATVRPDKANPLGEWTPERSALHDALRAEVLREGGLTKDQKALGPPQPTDHPHVVMLGGGPASGKSTVLGAGGFPLPDHPVTINPDDVKERMPEYQHMLNGDDASKLNAANFQHEESSSVSKMMLSDALSGDQKYNTVYDATGDNSLKSIMDKVAGFYAAGAERVDGRYVTCDTETAVQRAIARGEATGRVVNEAMLRDVHSNLSVTVPAAVEQRIWDSFQLWDTNGASPALIASYESKDAPYIIHDPVAYDRFLAKAKG